MNSLENQSFYQENRVFAFGCGAVGKSFALFCQKKNLALSGFVDNNPQKKGTSFHGFPVLSTEELQQQQGKGTPLNVVLTLSEAYAKEVAQQLDALGIPLVSHRPFTSPTLTTLYLQEFSRLYPEYHSITQSILQLATLPKEEGLILGSSPDIYPHLFVCQPSKTGDNTIVQTYNQTIAPLKIAHTHEANEFQKHLTKDLDRVRVVTALRDPVARDISSLFQLIANGGIFKYPDVTPAHFHAFLESGDAQFLFDSSLRHFILNKIPSSPPHPPRTVYRYEVFFKAFQTYILEVRNTPFDQEKGFSILKEGNIEVFFYQLEKLNSLMPTLSQWMDVPFDTLVNDNMAQEKWIADYYKKAQKELTFTQEYIDICYNDPYVRHCYSADQIEGFKAKWKHQIR